MKMVKISILKRCLLLGLLAAVMMVLSACEKSEVSMPAASNIDGDEIGYFCQMLLVNHTGPKGQVHLQRQAEPLWFTSVRDTIAYTLLPGESKAISAVYVNDMAHTSLDAMAPSSYWLDAAEAWFVLGSDAVGGMGMPEFVPFASQAEAETFRQERGGRVVRMGDILLADVQ